MVDSHDKPTVADDLGNRMPRRQSTVVIYTPDDLTRFQRECLAFGDMFLPLTPAARVAAAIQQAPCAVLASDTSTAHAVDAVRRLELAEHIQRALRRIGGLSYSGEQTLVDGCLDACGVASRVWQSLEREGRWIVPKERGWLETDDRLEATSELLERFFAPVNQSDAIANVGRTPPEIRRKLHRLNLRLLERLAHKPVVVLNAFTRGMEDFAQTIHDIDPEAFLLSFSPLNATEGSLDYVTTWTGYLDTNAPVRPRQITLTVPPRRLPHICRVVHHVLNTITDPIAAAGVAASRNAIVAQVEWVESIVPWFARYLLRARARAVLTWDHADKLNVALAEGARRAGVASLLACHTSVTPCLDEDARVAKSRRTRQLGSGDLADLAIVQSPLAEQAVRESAPWLPVRRVAPFVWGGRREDIPLKRAEFERVILHVGNYFEWASYLPWAYETSNDFVSSLADLVRSVSDLPDTRLVIRMKSNFARKGEFDAPTLRHLLPNVPCYEIREGGRFADDLAQADLVVGFHSTVIEEALHARRPVVLWGGDQRYCHVPARVTPPRAGDRAAVYFPANRTQLTGFLASILEAHAEFALTDRELSDYVWPADRTWTMSDLAHEVLKPDRVAAQSGSQRPAAFHEDQHVELRRCA
jgi:hypothetical protein